MKYKIINAIAGKEEDGRHFSYEDGSEVEREENSVTADLVKAGHIKEFIEEGEAPKKKGKK